MRVTEEPGGDDVPMLDRPEGSPELKCESEPAPPVARPKRRFLPQLIEQTTRSYSAKTEQKQKEQQQEQAEGSGSNNNGPLGPIPSISISKVTPTTGETSIRQQPNENATTNTPKLPTKPIRRFDPVPIETTFDSYRVANKNSHRPAPEPTPDRSPTLTPSGSTSPSNASPSNASPIGPHAAQQPQDERKASRRFAPQLIETSRRVRRNGQEGPATKPTDKTDITPGTNHIYAPKPKRKQGAPRPTTSGPLAHAVSGDDDERIPRFLGARRQHSIKPHPNTRRATRATSYHPELDTILSSESGNSSEEEEEDVAAPAPNLGAPGLSDTRSKGYGDNWSSSDSDLRNRRESCDEEFSGYLLGIAAREAHRQREFEQALSAFPNGVPPPGVEHFFARDNSESEDELEVGDDDEPPLRHGPSQLLRRKSTDPGWAVKEMRAHAERLAKMRAETCLSLDENSDQYEITPPPEDPLWTTTARRESHDLVMGSPGSPFLPAQPPLLCTKLPPLHNKPYTPPPSTGLSASPFSIPFALQDDESEDAELRKMRKAASPPMLGSDLVFRRCPSPQYTRMEPNYPYAQFDRREERNRDPSGVGGLWQGYCSSHAKQLDTPALQPFHLLHTPGTSSPTTDPFASAFAGSINGSGTQTPARDDQQPTTPHQSIPELNEKLGAEVQRGEREEALLAEFDDAFVTQVYNYLSLGYPATARAFDDELSKISGVSVEELRRDDTLKIGQGFMREMEINSRTGSTDSGIADVSGEENTAATTPAHEKHQRRHKPPRWEALKLYIHEWARQHPSLNDDEDSGPPAWGVRARRGSWAI